MFQVVVSSVVSVTHCIVSMKVNAAVFVGDLADKVLWVVVHFFLLSTEISVFIFGLAFVCQEFEYMLTRLQVQRLEAVFLGIIYEIHPCLGHLDSNTSIKWVLIVTFFISLAYSSTQGALEIVVPDEDFHVAHKDYDIFTHGRMLFWSISSVIFAAVYIVIFILPWTKLRERLDLPSKKSFYWYVLFLALLNITQAVGSGSIYYGEIDGICLVDVTTYIYFISFTPLVCWTFLAGIF
ncbi:transmembrane protein adipocyte-associated 1 homolog isoform X2 [Tachypleus tridentatus]|uniref:transmembrane protein adipocyte-associated 1 homolog isoform X2 n=1 Tax=Tachypleus tridentatus TaxID=6853 RepID=UPI003FD16B3B